MNRQRQRGNLFVLLTRPTADGTTIEVLSAPDGTPARFTSAATAEPAAKQTSLPYEIFDFNQGERG